MNYSRFNKVLSNFRPYLCEKSTSYIGVNLNYLAADRLFNKKQWFSGFSQNTPLRGDVPTCARPEARREARQIKSSIIYCLSPILVTSATYSTRRKMGKLTEQERFEALEPLLKAGWVVAETRDALYKEYLFNDFNQAFSFMSGVALLAEKINHHPEWLNIYNMVQVTLSTHDVGGLSIKDVRMAKYMDTQASRFLNVNSSNIE